MKRALSLQFAKALFCSTSSLPQLKLWKISLEAFLEALEKHSHFQALLTSPQFRDEEKDWLVQKCYKGPCEPKLLNFIKYVVKQQKLPYLKSILEEFSRMLNEKAGILQVILITARPVDSKILYTLKGKLKETYGKEIIIEARIQSSLIGGGILMIENRRWDFSIKNRLKQMKQTLLAEIRQES
ncbi:ATP synthase F1 subunit delta [Parachlamydia sp. AcF125]|uniref:ATP synthase F1 subunit delta n=1 Tax=Parachlamydia sp. AcF125 TaxID=2795736 RepID=UPI001BC9940F|nr:ATP synthase F1 subunit delta [Parachlamydia sp. AcF125]MBS4167488.1 ATP synthase subunit delta, sodium ion specific [Parachlamydia sp. AcF125]